METSAFSKAVAAAAGKPPPAAGEKSKSGKGERSKSSKSDKGKPDRKSRPPKPAQKVVYKVIVRKLPVDTITPEKLKNCCDAITTKLGTDSASIALDHFLQGKLSRKRGPVASVAYFAVEGDENVRLLLTNCPKVIPFMDGEWYPFRLALCCEIYL